MSRRCCAAECFNSSMINKQVSYFGFPKSEEGYRWAQAAGRDDLLSKPLDNLNKYYLCSDHFTDDCFLDPVTKTKLNKRTRPPQNYPMPSIFKSNFAKFVPPSIRNSVESEVELAQRVKRDLRAHNREKENRQRDKILIQRLKSEELEDISTNEPETIELQPDPPQVVDEILYCRLCTELVSDELIPIFEETGTVFHTIDQLLPNLICKDDGKPQNLCLSCFEKAKNCVETIYEFRENQLKFL